MVHVGNLRRPVRHDACGGGARVAFDDDFCSNGSKSSPHSSLKLNSMDEPPSPSNTQEEEDAEEEGGKTEQHDVPSSSTADWLQLGLGTSSPAPAAAPTSVGRRQSLTELQLFTDRPSSSSSAAVPWRSLSMPAAQFARRPGSGSVAADEAEAGQSGMRVVSPPRRQAGVWLMLQAAQTQGRQHFLAQIPRNYLRIKNERMTIRLMMRYLASKLSLEDESEPYGEEEVDEKKEVEKKKKFTVPAETMTVEDSAQPYDVVGEEHAGEGKDEANAVEQVATALALSGEEAAQVLEHLRPDIMSPHMRRRSA
ncbi:hypothetical protein Cni_G10474 [Canna indica]|uniref:Uncharacterized protein n=1 Tax=Canna indica TaxID=4628 RepID=A0AAQ3K7R6_9LILI|nr:hypothetical protein Cni_G10474 [Canna indica]